MKFAFHKSTKFFNQLSSLIMNFAGNAAVRGVLKNRLKLLHALAEIWNSAM
jgi:hypothetical protein